MPGLRETRCILAICNMSKRTTRSKKSSGDDNVPNFVFKFGDPGNTNTEFTFGSKPLPAAPSFGVPPSSAPPSPGQGTPSFSFTAPSGSQSSGFVFGSSSGQSNQPATTPFNFSTPSPSTSGAGNAALSSALRNSSDTPPSTPPSTAADAWKKDTGNVSAFSFGGQASTPAASAAAKPSGFTFGSLSTSSPATPSQPTGFSFTPASTPATSSNAASAAKPSAFTFGNVSTSTPASTQGTTLGTSAATNPTGFTFGNVSASAPASTPGTPLNAAAATNPSGFTFGNVLTSAPASPAKSTGFSFATASTPATSASATAPTSAFTFGAANTSSAGTTPSTSLSLGASAKDGTSTAPTSSTATATSGFTFGTPAASSAPASSATTFSFGKQDKTDTAATTAGLGNTTASSGFSFGVPAASAPTSNVSTPATSATSALATDKTNTQTPALFAGFAGQKNDKADKDKAPTFSFGSTSTAAKDSATPSTSLFTAGASTAAPATSSSTAPATGSTFSFGAQPAADPNKPNPFSLSKLVEQMEKMAAQPPNYVHASLITPTLLGLQPSHIVANTNFRIDNIQPTTRFSELPEQAQKELDELSNYIRNQSQRCNALVKHGVRQHEQMVENIAAETERLAQGLDALTSSIKGQLSVLEQMFETAGEQLRHAADASNIIEACKHPGQAAQWLFGYGGDDDYFVTLAKKLSDRVEEYKRTIWEIERTTESWTKHTTRTPQDIARIMQNQNDTLVALTNRVASLHEATKMQLALYEQYQKV